MLYSGPPEGLRGVAASQTARYLFAADAGTAPVAARRIGWLELRGVTRNNLQRRRRALPAGAFTAVTGVSGSGKSSLVSQALVELVAAHLGHEPAHDDDEARRRRAPRRCPHGGPHATPASKRVQRLVRVDQKPIGRTPRSNLATYTGLFDHVRKLFAATPRRARQALRRRPLLVQRGQGPLRDLRGRGLRQRRAAVHAQRLRALPGLPRRALQRGDAGRSPGRAGTSPTCCA